MGFVLALAVTSLLAAQTPQPSPTPQDCIRQGRDFSSSRQQELRPLTAEIVRQIDAERVKLVRDCAAGFDLDKVQRDQLPAMIDLYAEAQLPELAERAILRAASAEAADVRTRADVLVQAVRFLLRQPKSTERNARAERYSDELDMLPASAFEQQITVHNTLNGYYRADDIDAGIVKHSTWLMDAAKRASPEIRKKFGSSFTSAYKNLAEAVAGQGDNDRALAVLRRAPAELADIAGVEARIKPVLARYELVGKPAAPLVADAWLNRADAAAPLNLKGKVTLLQFTAHWCGPCKESYSGMKRLEARFKDRGLQVVFYTRTYGYFESERNLAREQEIERDRKYYAGYGFTLPIAIGTPSSTVNADGKTVYHEDPVERAYGVGGIPQINVVDADGNLRLIMIGYDDANEERLASFIEGLLKKKTQP